MMNGRELKSRSLQVKANLKSSPSLEPAMAAPADPFVLIGELARRAGVAASALRFYEEQGLLASSRSAGGQRQYTRSTLRRVAFIRAAQAVGLNLGDIKAALATLPGQRTPTLADWQRLSRGWQPLLDARIAALTQLRDQLSSCIGCGCLSLQRCKLYNPQDLAASRGSGPRYLMGNRAADVMAQAASP
jgi:MerR family transcriptional regulator, redox-sensitive transcriptional activator SoxR